MSLWSGSTDSKAIDYERINPREYQIVRTHTRKLTQRKLTQRMPRPGITQPPVAPCTDVSSEQQTKQKYKPNHQQTGLPPYSALPIRGKKKLSTNLTQYSTTDPEKPKQSWERRMQLEESTFLTSDYTTKLQ